MITVDSSAARSFLGGAYGVRRGPEHVRGAPGFFTRARRDHKRNNSFSNSESSTLWFDEENGRSFLEGETYYHRTPSRGITNPQNPSLYTTLPTRLMYRARTWGARFSQDWTGSSRWPSKRNQHRGVKDAQEMGFPASTGADDGSPGRDGSRGQLCGGPSFAPEPLKGIWRTLPVSSITDPRGRVRS